MNKDERVEIHRWSDNHVCSDMTYWDNELAGNEKKKLAGDESFLIKL